VVDTGLSITDAKEIYLQEAGLANSLNEHQEKLVEPLVSVLAVSSLRFPVTHDRTIKTQRRSSGMRVSR